MALSISRYSKAYQRLTKPDVAQHFPRHVFKREPNEIPRQTLDPGNLHSKQ